MTLPPAVTPQLPLALRAGPDQRLETLVGMPDGTVALLRAAARGDTADWLLLTGPAGTGKTHALLGACAAAHAHGRRAAYLPLAVAAGRVRDALASLEGHALLALDGIEAVAGDRDDEVALFDAHNRARAAGVSVLYAARDTPEAIGIALPDLRSRLGQCTRIALAPLDDAGRAEVLRVRAIRRGLDLDDAAIEWLLRHTSRDLASLTTALDTLDRASLAAQRRVTVPFLKRVLGRG